MGKFFDNPVLLIALVVIIVLVFGANKLPGAARSLGRSMRIFKSEVKQMKDDDEPDGSPESRADPPLEGRVVDDRGGRRPDDSRSGHDGRSAQDAPRTDT